MFLTSFIKTFQTSRVNSKKWRGDQYQAKTKLLHQILKKIQCRKLGKSKKNPENSHEKVEGNDIRTEIGFRNTRNKTLMCDILV